MESKTKKGLRKIGITKITRQYLAKFELECQRPFNRVTNKQADEWVEAGRPNPKHWTPATPWKRYGTARRSRRVSETGRVQRLGKWAASALCYMRHEAVNQTKFWRDWDQFVDRDLEVQNQILDNLDKHCPNLAAAVISQIDQELKARARWCVYPIRTSEFHPRFHSLMPAGMDKTYE